MANLGTTGVTASAGRRDRHTVNTAAGTVDRMAEQWTFPPNPHGLFHGDGWKQSFWVNIPGAVVSKSNHRKATATSGSASWRKVKNYESEVSFELRRARPQHWPTPPMSLPPRESRLPFVAVIAAVTRMDAGNISKSLLDAAQGVIYFSDAHVLAVSEIVERSGTPGTLIAFAVPDHDTHPALAVSELTRKVHHLLTAENSPAGHTLATPNG